MEETVQHIHSKPKQSVEIIVHVDESLDQEQRNKLVVELELDEAINSAEFCNLRNHLMLVNYNKDMLASQDVLGRVKSQNIHAELIGPV